MFTGLVQAKGRVSEVRESAESKRLVIEAKLDERGRELGASVAVAGVCLTVTSATAEHFDVEAAFETLALTTLGDLRSGSVVNLEPALRVGDALGGHLVSGHVDGVAMLVGLKTRGDARECTFEVPAELAKFAAPKGSICIDGVSLTINEVDQNQFSVGLIPHTLSVTTLGALQPGSRVNIEVDLLARYVARLLEHGESAPTGVTSQRLVEAGLIPDTNLRGSQ